MSLASFRFDPVLLLNDMNVSVVSGRYLLQLGAVQWCRLVLSGKPKVVSSCKKVVTIEYEDEGSIYGRIKADLMPANGANVLH